MIFLAGLLFAAHHQEQAFDPLQRQAISDALYIANLTEVDLKTEGAWGLGNAYVALFHQDPLKQIGTARQVVSQENVVGRLRREFLSEEFDKHAQKSREFVFPEELPIAVREPLRSLINATLNATDEAKAAIRQLSSSERRELIEGLPSHAVHSSLLNFDFVKERPKSWEYLTGLLAKVDLGRLRNAAENLFVQVERTLPSLNSVAPSSFQSKVRFAVEGVPIVVAGFADDLHEDKDAGLTIDFGGNDRYTGRHGAGIGYASVLLDLDGNDTYTVPDISLGAGLLGIGVALDIGGEDVLRGKSICLGAGIAGVGVFESRGRLTSAGGFGVDENDLYECTSMGAGFGLFGIGALVDTGGADVYRSRYLSQGSAYSAGIGALEDSSGNDRYFADGLAPTLESDVILRARSQGFGGRIGYGLGESGGIGSLMDADGRDVCVSGAESQGCGLDAGLGILSDSSEGDTYRCEGYGQGYGARSGVGILIEHVGDDEYVCSQSAAQGFANDSGIGALLDWKGNDLHSIASGPSGYASYGGLGMFFDWDGFDRYSSTPSQRSNPVESRGTSLFLDFGGANQIGGSSVGPIGTISGAWTVVAMLESRRETDSVSPPELKPAALPVSPDEVESNLAEAAGLADYATRSMRFQAKANLAAFPRGVLVWLNEQKRPLHNSEVRVLGEIFRNAPEDSRADIIRMASVSNAVTANNALQILSESGLRNASSAILKAFQNVGTAANAIRAALSLGLQESSSELMVLCASPDPLIRREAAIAMSRLGGPEAISTAQVLLSNEDPVIRKAAVELFGKVGLPNIDPLKALAISSAEPAARATVQATAAIGNADALAFLGTKLTDTRAGVRIEALRGLAGRCPRAYRAAFEARKEDADSRVRTVALSLDPGR